LEALCERGTRNGAPGLRMLEGAALAAEPALRAVAALESPSTGIVDAHALCLSLAAEAESHGAAIVLHTEVEAIERTSDGYRIATRSAEGEGSSVECAAVVNAAGLDSDRVAERAGIDVDARGYRLHLCKGDYFSLAPGAPLRCSRLLYPIPAGPGLGVHLALALRGRRRFRPAAEDVARPPHGGD